MASHRIIVSGSSQQFVRELRAHNATVYHSLAGEELRGVTPGSVDAWLIDPETLQRLGAEVVRVLRERDPALAVLLTRSDQVSLPVVQRLGLLCGADDVLEERSMRAVMGRVERAITRRRSRAHHPLLVSERPVLLVDWHPTQTSAVQGMLREQGFPVDRSPDTKTALLKLRSADPGIVLCPPAPGPIDLPLVECILRYDPGIRVVVVSGEPDLSDTVGALAIGAHDYLLQPVGPKQAQASVEAARAAFERPASALRPSADVLLLDDNGAHAELTRQLLRANPALQVHPARSLAQAESLLKNRRFDVLVVSPDLKEANPLQVMHRMRTGAPAAPLVLLSSEDEPWWRAQAFRLDAEDVLYKPHLGRSDLAGRVENAILRAKNRMRRQQLLHDVQLREASQQEVVRRSLDGMVVVDAQGFVVFANPAAERMFGRGSGELLGVRLPIEVSSGGPAEVEIPGSQPMFAERSCVEVDWNGAKATLMSLRNVTERHSAQILREQLTHSDRLAAIGQLAAGVAHEINNPSAFVVANLIAMRKELARLTPEADTSWRAAAHELRKMVDENLEGMERIQSISAELKAFARVDSHEVMPVDINQCVEVACKLVQQELRPRAQLRKKLRPLPAFKASSGKLSQVVTNRWSTPLRRFPRAMLTATSCLSVRRSGTERSSYAWKTPDPGSQKKCCPVYLIRFSRRRRRAKAPGSASRCAQTSLVPTVVASRPATTRLGEPASRCFSLALIELCRARLLRVHQLRRTTPVFRSCACC